ncbi:MAG: hypothetical protein ACKOJG_09865 [Actinomycetota bacterium]
MIHRLKNYFFFEHGHTNATNELGDQNEHHRTDEPRRMMAAFLERRRKRDG